MLAEGFQLINALEDAPFPVIAAVHGMCFAAGLELALACDLIIAAEGAQFAQVEAKIGAATFLGGVYRLAERCGPARAKEIVFGAETYDAATFERWNIVNRVVPDEDLREAAALAWAQQLAKGPTLAHAVTKRLLRHALDQGSRQADSSETNVCRSSRGAQSLPSPALSYTSWNIVRMCLAPSGVPVAVVNTLPVSCQCDPAASRSAAGPPATP